MLLAGVLFVVLLSVRAEVVVQPEVQHFKSPGSGAVKCLFATPLAECMVRISAHLFEYRFNEVLNFSRGEQSPSVKLYYNKYTWSYAGKGLFPEGECGAKVELDNGDHSVIFVECFGKTLEGQWGRGYGIITVESWDVLPVTYVSPLLVVPAPGSNVSMLIRAEKSFKFCRVKTMSAGEERLDWDDVLDSDSRYLEHGAGPSNKECGVALKNVTEQDSGIWLARAFDRDLAQMVFHTPVVLVQVAPEGDPILEIEDPDNLKIGDVILATCYTPAAVPAPNITWLLGGHVVRHDDYNNTLPGDLGKSRPWDRQPRHQIFTHRLTSDNFGKLFECRMDHVTLSVSKSVGQQLIAPGNLTADHSVVRSTVGHQSQLACHLQGQPNTTFRWTRAGVQMQESQFIRIGNNGTLHWLLFEDTDPEDFADYACSASRGNWSMSQIIKLTGLPGKPEWAGSHNGESTTPLTWRVESIAPLTASTLKVRQGKEPWQVFTKHAVTGAGPGWQLVTFTGLLLPPGTYTAYLRVENWHGFSAASQFQEITLVSVTTTATTIPTPAASTRGSCVCPDS